LIAEKAIRGNPSVAGRISTELTGFGGCCHLAGVMSVTLQLDLPDALVEEARAAGLLDSARLADWLTDELRRKRAREEFGGMLRRLHSVDDEPMGMEEIQAEVDAVREDRRRREGGS
jgi:hypothetical protein